MTSQGEKIYKLIIHIVLFIISVTALFCFILLGSYFISDRKGLVEISYNYFILYGTIIITLGFFAGIAFMRILTPRGFLEIINSMKTPIHLRWAKKEIELILEERWTDEKKPKVK